MGCCASRSGTPTPLAATAKMSCCPPGSWPDLNNDGYACKGSVDTLDEASAFKVYKTGSGPKCVIWNYDIFGFDGGRTRQMADYVAAQGLKTTIQQAYQVFVLSTGAGFLADFPKLNEIWSKIHANLFKIHFFGNLAYGYFPCAAFTLKRPKNHVLIVKVL